MPRDCEALPRVRALVDVRVALCAWGGAGLEVPAPCDVLVLFLGSIEGSL